jgi:hypothetical protein
LYDEVFPGRKGPESMTIMLVTVGVCSYPPKMHIFLPFDPRDEKVSRVQKRVGELGGYVKVAIEITQDYFDASP